MNKTMLRIGLILLLTLLPAGGSVTAQQNTATGSCKQSAVEQDSLITEAERQQFTVRRVEFLGLTHTPDQVVRERMTSLVNEGDLFSRKKLVKSLQRMSKLRRAVYPPRMSDVILRLERTEKLVDMTICFRERAALMSNRIEWPPANTLLEVRFFLHGPVLPIMLIL